MPLEDTFRRLTKSSRNLTTRGKIYSALFFAYFIAIDIYLIKKARQGGEKEIIEKVDRLKSTKLGQSESVTGMIGYFESLQSQSQVKDKEIQDEM